LREICSDTLELRSHADLAKPAKRTEPRNTRTTRNNTKVCLVGEGLDEIKITAGAFDDKRVRIA